MFLGSVRVVQVGKVSERPNPQSSVSARPNMHLATDSTNQTGRHIGRQSPLRLPLNLTRHRIITSSQESLLHSPHDLLCICQLDALERGTPKKGS